MAIKPFRIYRPALACKLRSKSRGIMVQSNRRKSQRFLIQLPLVVRWTDGTSIGEAEAQTQDVSSGGVRFNISQAPKTNSAIEILMALPRQLTNAGPVRVRCRGQVVRTNAKSSEEIEVVAEIERFQFVRDEENVA
jgi:hypothetical protein